MSTSLLPELAAESVETAERLVRLSGESRLDPAEAEYILRSGVAALERVPQLWPIILSRIGAGTSAAAAGQLLTRLLDAVDRNLTLARVLKEPARILRQQTAQEPEAAAGLAQVEERLHSIRGEASRLLRSVEAPASWPEAQQLEEAKEQMRGGNRLNPDEFRQALSATNSRLNRLSLPLDV